MQFALNMDREKLNKISKYCKKMKYLEEKKQFSEDYKRAVLEQIKKKRQIMDKLVAKESKIRNVGDFILLGSVRFRMYGSNIIFLFYIFSLSTM